ncbi:hypothetical protein, partial [Bathymodiolus platifrons methanotrophic gill symbiont]
PEKTINASDKNNYSFHSAVNKMNASAENILILSFSGGGTRAAAKVISDRPSAEDGHPWSGELLQ